MFIRRAVPPTTDECTIWARLVIDPDPEEGTVWTRLAINPGPDELDHSSKCPHIPKPRRVVFRMKL